MINIEALTALRMSYIAGTGILQGGNTSTNQINIQVDVEQVTKNKNDISTLFGDIENLTTDAIAEGTEKLYYTE